jgi:hypothetical protein
VGLIYPDPIDSPVLRKTALEAIDEYNAYKRRGIPWPTPQSSTNTEDEQMDFANRCADQIENLEMSAERRMAESTKGVPEGMFRCCCGSAALLSEAMPASDNPYATPICPACFDEAFPRRSIHT